MIICYRRFGKNQWPNLQCYIIQKDFFLISGNLLPTFGTTYGLHLQGEEYKEIFFCNKLQFISDVSVKPIGFIFRVQVYKKSVFIFFTPEDGIDRVSRNVGNKLPLLAA